MEYWKKSFKKFGVVLGLAPALLLWPALGEKFPLFWSDTENYIQVAHSYSSLWIRSVFYSFFIQITSLSGHLMSVVLVQAWAVTIVVRIFFNHLRLGTNRTFLAIIFILALFTGLPWTTSTLIPDFSTSIMGISFFLIVLKNTHFSKTETNFLYFTLFFTTVLHLANIPICFLMVISAYFYRFIKGTEAYLSKNNIKITAFIFLFSISSLSTVHLAFRHRLLGHGQVWIMSRLVKDGIVSQLLADRCKEEAYTLCKYQNELKTFNTHDAFIWKSDASLNTRNWDDKSNEFWNIILESITRYPIRNIELALINAKDLFLSLKTSDYTLINKTDQGANIKQYYPEDFTSWENAWSSNSRVKNTLIYLDGIHTAVAKLCLILSLIIATLEGNSKTIRYFSFYTLYFLAVNAFVCAAFSGVFDRYQVRVVWLSVLASIFFFLSSRNGKKIPSQGEIGIHSPISRPLES